MEHTEGPWEVRDDIEVYAVNGINRYICTCSGNARANARLLAAAPDLLAALEELVKVAVFSNIRESYPVVAAQAAIAKAKGGQ